MIDTPKDAQALLLFLHGSLAFAVIQRALSHGFHGIPALVLCLGLVQCAEVAPCTCQTLPHCAESRAAAIAAQALLMSPDTIQPGRLSLHQLSTY